MTRLYDGQITDLLLNDAKHDPHIQALAYAILLEKRRLMDFADGTRTMVAIDDLPESALDLLACDFAIDWWNADASDAEKRAVLKTAWKVHAKKGAKDAVETAVSAVSPGATVREWFEYGGNPYCFRIRIETDGRDLTDAARERLLRNVQYYKNARSHLDTVEYALDPDAIPPASLRLAPVAGDVYIRLTIPAPVMPQNVALYGVTIEDGDLYQVSLGDSPTLSIDDEGFLCQEYDPETEQPRTFIIEDGVLYEEESE